MPQLRMSSNELTGTNDVYAPRPPRRCPIGRRPRSQVIRRLDLVFYRKPIDQLLPTSIRGINCFGLLPIQNLHDVSWTLIGMKSQEVWCLALDITFVR